MVSDFSIGKEGLHRNSYIWGKVEYLIGLSVKFIPRKNVGTEFLPIQRKRDHLVCG